MPSDPSDEFPERRSFESAVRYHFSAQRDLAGPGHLNTPFVSATTSIRYAVSVAELHAQRWGKSIAITTIDYKSLAHPRPIWNAYEVALQSNVERKTGIEDSRNEYLIYDAVEGNGYNSVTVPYFEIEPYLNRLMPSLRKLRNRNNKHRRFCDYLDEAPVKATLPAFQDGHTAYELAIRVAPKQIRLATMTSLLLLQRRELANDTELHIAISDLVVNGAKEAESGILTHYVELMCITAGSVRLRVRDFLSPQYVPARGSNSAETTHLCYCLLRLRRLLHTHQEYIFARRLNGLSTAALMLRKFLDPEGVADTMIKQFDRGESIARYQSVVGSQDLIDVFAGIRQAVQEAVNDLSCISPLVWLHDPLKEASVAASSASQLDVSAPLRNHQILSSNSGFQ